jgi:hypothetical protein
MRPLEVIISTLKHVVNSSFDRLSTSILHLILQRLQTSLVVEKGGFTPYHRYRDISLTRQLQLHVARTTSTH